MQLHGVTIKPNCILKAYVHIPKYSVSKNTSLQRNITVNRGEVERSDGVNTKTDKMFAEYALLTEQIHTSLSCAYFGVTRK